MTPARPSLAAVLAALTDTDESEWRYWLNLSGAQSWFALTAAGVEFTVRHWPFDCDLPWITTDPAFAWEVLQTRGIIPDGYVGRFVCEVCADPSIKSDVRIACVNGVMTHPQSIRDLVAFASLGFAMGDDDTLGVFAMEETAAALYPVRRVVWKVATQQTFAMQSDGCEFRFPTTRTVAITIPSMWAPRQPAGTLVFPPTGGVQVIDRDGNTVDIGTNGDVE